MRYRLLCLWAALALAACASNGRAASPLVRDLELFATTDLHGHLEPADVPGHHSTGKPRFTTLGGLALIGGLLRNARQHYPGRVILLDGGDMFQGTLASNLVEGASMVRGLNVLGYAAAALGNHEFDYGPTGPAPTPRAPGDDPRGALRARMKQANFPVLGANVVDDRGEAVFPTHHLIEIDGVKVGIVGGTSESLFQTTMRANLVGLRVLPLAPALVAAAQQARREGARVIVATVHAGAECARATRTISSDQPGDLTGCKGKDEVFELAHALAQAQPVIGARVAAIVAGHTHQPITAVVDGIPILQSGKNGHYLSHVSIEVRGRGAEAEATGRFRIERPIDVCARVTEKGACAKVDEPGGRALDYFGPVRADTAVAAAIHDDLVRAHSIAERPIGIELPEGLAASYGEESPLGNFVADAVQRAGQAQIGFVNGGGLRADLPPGPLRYGSLYESFPFDNEVVAIEVSGTQLIRMVRNNLRSHFGAISYGGLHVRASCVEGKLVAELSLESGAPIEPRTRYRVATLDFLARGGDGAVDNPRQVGGPYGVVRDVLEAAFKARGGTLRPSDGLFDTSRRRVELPGPRPIRCRDAAGREEPADVPAAP